MKNTIIRLSALLAFANASDIESSTRPVMTEVKMHQVQPAQNIQQKQGISLKKTMQDARATLVKYNDATAILKKDKKALEMAKSQKRSIEVINKLQTKIKDQEAVVSNLKAELDNQTKLLNQETHKPKQGFWSKVAYYLSKSGLLELLKKIMPAGLI